MIREGIGRSTTGRFEVDVEGKRKSNECFEVVFASDAVTAVDEDIFVEVL